jgi:hypothetical protein
MGINMTNFKMVYKDNVYNCLSMMPTLDGTIGNSKVNFLEVIYIDSDNRVNVVYDEVFMFQFISK